MGKPLHIGLSFYGGVSLAVFEAGVAYELIRTIQFSRENPDLVNDIHVDVISGTSAGGLAALQLACALGGHGYTTERILEKILSIWASDADIQNLIPKSDFNGQGFLDNNVLRRRAEELLKCAAGNSECAPAEASPQAPINGSTTQNEEPLEKDLEIYLTMTNLSGLREPVVLPNEHPRAFPTIRHYEYERFTREDVISDVAHKEFVNAAIVTSDFPAAFPPTKKKSTALPSDVETQFLYVDGGVVDNRPLGVAIDAMSRRPVENRTFFFIDPSETYEPPSFEGNKPLQDDPLAIVGRVFTVARHDTILRDLRETLRVNENVDLLVALSRIVAANSDFRKALHDGKLESGQGLTDAVLERFFYDGPRELWMLVEPLNPDKSLTQLWQNIKTQPRFVLKERLWEYIRHRIGDDETARTYWANVQGYKEKWNNYYTKVRSVNALNRDFRDLRYHVWQSSYAPTHGLDPKPLDKQLAEKIKSKLQELRKRVEELTEARTDLAKMILNKVSHSFAQELKGTDLLDDFYQYARAMQILESLGGLQSKAHINVRRITPFDMYPDSTTSLDEKKPVAGGELGSFGGFLDRRWRENDFAVGREAMRQVFRRERILTDENQELYLEFCVKKDQAIIEHLKHVGDAESFQIAEEIEKFLQGIQDWQLPASEKNMGALPARGIVMTVRGLAHSMRGLLQRNNARFPYNLVGLLRPMLWVLEFILLLIQPGLEPTSSTTRPSHSPEKTSDFVRTLRRTWVFLFIGIFIGIILSGLVPILADIVKAIIGAFGGN